MADDEALADCPTCGGTGDVHSHNPICWDCEGGKVTELRRTKIMQQLTNYLEPKDESPDYLD